MDIRHRLLEGNGFIRGLQTVDPLLDVIAPIDCDPDKGTQKPTGVGIDGADMTEIEDGKHLLAPPTVTAVTLATIAGLGVNEEPTLVDLCEVVYEPLVVWNETGQ